MNVRKPSNNTFQMFRVLFCMRTLVAVLTSRIVVDLIPYCATHMFSFVLGKTFELTQSFHLSSYLICPPRWCLFQGGSGGDCPMA